MSRTIVVQGRVVLAIGTAVALALAMTAFVSTAAARTTAAHRLALHRLDGYTEFPIACPPQYAANGGPLLNTIAVAQIGGHSLDDVPFVISYYNYKRGVASSGLAVYWPTPTTAVYGGSFFDWIDAGVTVRCTRQNWGLFTVDVYANQSYEGIAVPTADPMGDGSGGTIDDGGGYESSDGGYWCDDFYWVSDDGHTEYIETVCSPY